MHQNVVLAFFHTRNICHGAWKILRTTLCCFVFLQSRGEGLKSKENFVPIPGRPFKNVMDSGSESETYIVFDFRIGSNWKYANTCICVFSVWPLPKVKNWFWKQFWNKKVHITILNFFVEHFNHQKKVSKMDLPYYFQKRNCRVRVVIFELGG